MVSQNNNNIQFMTWTKCFKDKHTISLWYLTIMLWNCIRTNFCFTADKCPTGTFKSDFLSGGCVLCPRKLKYCENEELDDSVRCFNACRKIFSTVQPTQKPTTTQEVFKSSTSARHTTLTTKALEISTQLYEVSSKRHDAYQKFKTTLAASSLLRNSTNKRSGESNTTDIKIGATISILALILVVVVLCAVCWTGRSNSTKDPQQDSIHYVAVPPSSISNGDENMNTETEAQTDVQIEDENVEISLPALSCECLNEMPETDL